VESYYTGKFLEFGEAARGVDWKSPEHQQLRFEQLLHVLDGEDLTDASLLDYGCGYGALYGVVRSRFPQLNYFGFDLSNSCFSSVST